MASTAGRDRAYVRAGAAKLQEGARCRAQIDA